MSTLFDELDIHAINFVRHPAIRPEDKRKIDDMMREIQNLMRSIIEEGIDQGVFVNIDSVLTVNALVGALQSIRWWYRPGGRLSQEEVKTKLIELLMRGVLVKA